MKRYLVTNRERKSRPLNHFEYISKYPTKIEFITDGQSPGNGSFSGISDATNYCKLLQEHLITPRDANHRHLLGRQSFRFEESSSPINLTSLGLPRGRFRRFGPLRSWKAISKSTRSGANSIIMNGSVSGGRARRSISTFAK